jgi:hypothetical protein
MSVQLIIDGNHITDVIAQVQQLATALGGTVEPSKEAGATTSQTTTTTAAPSQEPSTSSTTQTSSGEKPLTRKEQDEAVKYMINQKEKDDRFEKLTKGRQEEVEAALAKAAEPVDEKKADADLDDMFADDATETAKVVSREDVSNLMAKIGKDKDGNPIQDKLLKIRAILVENIPEGNDPKVKNIPEDKLATVYSLIEKIGV